MASLLKLKPWKSEQEMSSGEVFGVFEGFFGVRLLNFWTLIG